VKRPWILLLCLSIALVASVAQAGTTYRYDPSTGHFLQRIGRRGCASPKARARLLDTAQRIEAVEVTPGQRMALLFRGDDKGLHRTISRQGLGDTGSWPFPGPDGGLIQLVVHVDFLAVDPEGTLANEIRVEARQVYQGASCVETWVVDGASATEKQ
jgi:hypothetical protein